MKIERFEIPGLAQYSYLISSAGKAAVVDPIRDIDRYLDYAARHHLTITHVLETHIHADFASGSIALRDATGAELAFSAYDQGEHYRYAMPHRSLRDGDEIVLGNTRIQALHTPGHTPEHVSFAIFDPALSSEAPSALLSGDFLFVGSVGRPDLLGEDAKLALARQLYRSLHQRLAALPDAVRILPGHGAGSLCGTGMSDRSESTLGNERATNPLFQLSEEAFVREVLETVPPMPTYYPRMKALNAQGAPPLTDLPGSRELSVAEVQDLQRNGATLLDLRRPEAFGGAHIPGAINIGAGQNLSLWAGWLLDPEKPILLIAEGNPGGLDAACRSLVRVGLDSIAGHLAGGIASWIDAGLEFATLPQRNVFAVLQAAPGALLLDVRSDQEWQAGHIAGARHIALGNLAASVQELPRNQPMIVVCGSGYRSSIAASMLQRAGFSSVSSMAGGIAAWQRRNLPFSPD
jgi:hydroxyacylglutathione hydrolase